MPDVTLDSPHIIGWNDFGPRLPDPPLIWRQRIIVRDVNPETTISELKQKISEVLNVPVGYSLLVNREIGRELGLRNDTLRLSDALRRTTPPWISHDVQVVINYQDMISHSITIQKRFRGNKSRLKSSSDGYLTKHMKDTNWPESRNMLIEGMLKQFCFDNQFANTYLVLNMIN